MTRVLLTLLIGLVVSLGTLVSGVDPVLAKNWNQSHGSNNQSLGNRLEYKYPPNYNPTYSCDGSGFFNDKDNIFKVSKNSIIFDRMVFGAGRGNMSFEYNRDTSKLTKSGMDLPTSMRVNGLRARDLNNFIKPYDMPRFLIDGKIISVGQKFSYSDLKLITNDTNLSGSTDFHLEAFEKHQNMTVASGKYSSTFSGSASGQRIKIELRGRLKYHLGTGFIVHNSVTSVEVKNGLQTSKGSGGTLDCSLVGEERLHQKVKLALDSKNKNDNDSIFELETAAEKEAERLRQRVAALEAKQKQQKQTISSDTKLPTITIASVNTKGKQGIVRGRVDDNTGIAEVTVDGTVVPVTSNGNFEYSTFVPSGGLSLKVQATDLAGLTSMMSVTLERNVGTATAAINFDRLNPIGKRVKTNKDALALIVGVADYENTPAKAIFADSDAMMFQDYASEKLGIPESRIKTLVNDGADERELLLSVKSWLARASKQGKTDVYVFFAGHGLASDNGEKMYLLPYDGSPELLDDTAILRDRLFSDIASANPRSVTVFLDTCYSGTTRGTDMLIASRPIAIKALKQSVPDNFTVFTAAAGDQTAKPLEEAKHGMFSYFLMKGMEGEADKNQDSKITAGELHQYVQQNVVQQSSGSQTPELQGNAERVLVRFQ